MKRWLIFTAFVLSFASSLIGQTVKPSDDTKADETKERLALLADQVQTDTAGLALGENRAFINARVGVLLCKTDKKAAATLFQSAVGDLVNAQSMAEAEAKNRPSRSIYETRITQSIRPTILTTIAVCDAAYALEGLYRTRTTAIQRALAQNVDPSGKISEIVTGNVAYARTELALEQKLTLLAATQNPELAIKMLQESIRKGVSAETLGLLKKLFDKDPESANSLAADVLDRLSSSNFSNEAGDIDNVTLTVNILNDYIRAKKPGVAALKFDDLAIRSLAQKLISFTLTPDPRFGPQRFAAVIAIAEKLSPGSVAALKKMLKSSQPARARGFLDLDARRLLNDNVSASQMLSDAKRLSPDARPMIYQAAASKMAQGGDISGASDLLRSNFSGTALENAVNQINAAYATYMIAKGKFAEAERFIDEFPEGIRRYSLLSLATAAFRKDKVENKPFALNVLRKVRGLMPDRPADGVELSQFMQLTNAYASIEPDEAFATLEPLVPQLNELADATAVVQGFQNNFNVRTGEFEMGTGSSYGFQFDPSVLRTLAKADFDRTLKLIDTFTRRELRIAYRLQLAESGLK